MEYAKLYKIELAKGKSTLYAHTFSDIMVGGNYHKIYCKEYSYAYEQAILNGKNEGYAFVYADKYADLLTDIKRRAGISEDEDAIEFAKEKAAAYIKAWEYITEHKVVDRNRFSEIYENLHLNTYFADNGMPNGTLEEIDKEILEKALLKYNKL